MPVKTRSMLQMLLPLTLAGASFVLLDKLGLGFDDYTDVYRIWIIAIFLFNLAFVAHAWKHAGD
jgi:hypothetical protein